jgi:hypothetical protein
VDHRAPRIGPGDPAVLVQRSSVAVHDGTALVGSPSDNAAYVYDLPDLCPADFAEPYTQLDFFDVTDFLERFAGEDAWADLAAPTGVFDASDFAAFLNAYTNGCP